MQFLVKKYLGTKRNKTMTDKLMYPLNDDTQNYPFYRLLLVVETIGHSQMSLRSLRNIFEAMDQAINIKILGYISITYKI